VAGRNVKINEWLTELWAVTSHKAAGILVVLERRRWEK
jgi:hypothetical protein